jgi:hypothetical protein
MKTDSIAFSSPVPSLFQIAAFFEDFFPNGAANIRSRAGSLRHLPFADFMVNPERLMALLGAAKSEARGAASAVDSGVRAAARRPVRTGSSPRKPTPPSPKNGSPSPDRVKKVEFRFRSPAANSVQLAGDFTEWEKNPVDMMHSEDGTWFTVVPLAPGQYSYRFIVDGAWCDDPGSDVRLPNPFGTENAVIRVT